MTTVTMLAMVAFGAYSLLNLETDELPDIQNPVVAVLIAYPGASPDVVASEILDPVEEALSGISGVDKIRSTAQDGFAQVITFFVFSKSVDQASQDIRDALSGIRINLPQEMKEPILRRFNPEDQPIVSLTLSSLTMTAPELTRIADPGLTRELRGLAGVAQVNLAGALERELTVQLRAADLEAYGVSSSQVVQGVQTQNLAAPVGSVIAANDERTIRLRGRLQTPADFSQLVVAQRKGQLIRLGALADVIDGAEEPRTAALFTDRQAVGLDILKTKGISTTKVSDDINARVAALQRTLPGDARLTVVRDAGERIRRSVHNVQRTLVEGAVLTVLVVFVFLNSWRSTVITGLALPVSVIAAFIAVYALGFTLNTMSLLGLSLAIGLLVDDAIVVRENIVRHIEMGEDHYTAARTGTDEIGLAVAATTFSIVAVFVPVGFMSGIAGQFFKPFALTIASSVLVSLFVSFSLDPMLSAYWPDPQLEKGERRGALSRALERFSRWFDRQGRRYQTAIAWSLDHRWTMVALAIGSLAAALVLQIVAGGFGFVPVSDRSEMTITIDAPPGASLGYTRVKSEEVGRIVRAHPAVDYTYTTIGSSEGLGGVDQASMYVRLVPKGERDVSQDVFGRMLRAELQRVAGIMVSVYGSGFAGNQKQIQVEVRSRDIDPATLTAVAEQVAERVRQVPGAVDVALSTKGQKPELDVQIHRGLAGTLGIPVAAVAQALRTAFAGVQAGEWIDPSGKTRKVMVRLPPEERRGPADLQRLPLALEGLSTTGPTVLPLNQIATVQTSVGPAQVQHYNRDSVIVVGANVEGRSLGRVAADINARLASLPLPPGHRVSQGGEVESQNQVFGGILSALGLAVLMMYLILVAQFGSFVDPIAIMLSLPLSLIGVVVALIVTRDTLNVMSLIGVVLLMGIVAKNAILLVDFAKWSRERGTDRRQALIEAGRIRFRPIMMTTLALIAGMVPVALGYGEGGDFRAPLGRAVIGGVITSTVLTLIVIPTAYDILDDWRAAVIARFRLGLAHPDNPTRVRAPQAQSEAAIPHERQAR